MSDNGKKKTGAFKIAAILVAVIVIGLFALTFLFDANQFRPELQSRLSAALGRKVETGNLSLALFSGAVGVDDITVADDPNFSSAPFLKAKSLKVGVELMPLIFSKEVRITEISLDGPAINLIQSSGGRWNFSGLAGATKNKKNGTEDVESSGNPGPGIAIRKLTIENGSVTIARGGRDGKPSTYSDVDITAKNVSFTSEFPFTMSAVLPGNGRLSLEGTAGPVNSADLMKTPLTADLEVEKFDLVQSGFAPSDSGFAGIVDFDGLLTSDGRQVKSRGSARADRLQIVKGGSPAGRPVSLEYAVSYDLSQQKGALEETKMVYGEAVANLSGNFQKRRDALSMTMRLLGKDMPVEDMKTLLPAFGVVLPKGADLKGGVLNADMTASGPVDRMTIAGSADISNTSVVGFDLAGNLAAVAQLAGIQPGSGTDIETLASSMRMTPEGTRINPIKLVVPAIGEVTGSGVINPDQTLDFKMRALLKSSGRLGGGLAQLMGGAGGGQVTVPFFIRGTASEPKFIPDMAGAAGGILGSRLSGQETEGEESSTGKAIGDALKGLFGE
ncbi:MAG: AsmA family protein [Acidobacteria bacterium]|nr:AsmA family protein [Acidobacteriota bacterium]